MPRRPRDLNQLAKMVVDIASGEVEDTESPKKRATTIPGRNGGLKGGRSRSVSLTAEERQEIARLAARARWKKQD